MAIVSVASTSTSSMERLSYDRSLLRSSTESYSPLERAVKYSNSKVVLQRLVLIREFIDICHDVGYGKATSTLIPILKRLARDSDEDVRRGALSILGDLVGFLVQSDLEEGYKVVLSHIVPMIKEVLVGDSQQASISVKEVACRVGITLCSHLRHSDRVHSILSIGLALANDLENDDSRCLASWMLNGLAEYMGRDICVQFIVPQIKCLADDHTEKVRVFATMNLCEVIRITQSFSELLPVFKRLILWDSKSVRMCAVKVIIGVFSSIKTVDKTSFSTFLVEIFREISDDDLANELSKQIGPLITLFKDPDCIPKEILDAYLEMGMSSVHEEPSSADGEPGTDLGASDMKDADVAGESSGAEGGRGHMTLAERSEPTNSRLSVSNEGPREGSDDISLLPFGNNLGLTFRELELNEPSYFCSYSFASVFSNLGPDSWPEFSLLLVGLVESPNRSVRLPIAASMSLILATALSCGDKSHSHSAGPSSCCPNSSLELASLCSGGIKEADRNERSSADIKKEQDEFSNTIEKGMDLFYNNIHRDPARYLLKGSSFKLPCSKGCQPRSDRLPLLHEVIGKLLDDSDTTVKRAIFGCLSDIIKCLPQKEHIEAIIKKFPDLLNSCRSDWRCRNVLANQIRKICIELHSRNVDIRKQSETPQELFTGRFAQEYLSPVAFSLLLDPVSEVRKTAINSVSSLLRISSPFLWYFFQNGGNVHDLPSPIRPLDPSPREGQTQTTPSNAASASSTSTVSSTTTSASSTSTPSPTPSQVPDNSSRPAPDCEQTVSGEYLNCGQVPDSPPKDTSNPLFRGFQPLVSHKQSTCMAVSSISSFSGSPNSLSRGGGGAGCPSIIVSGVGGFSIQSSRFASTPHDHPEFSFPENLRVLFSLDEENSACKLLNELALIWCILKTFAMSPKYYHRQEFIQMSDRFIRDIPRGFFYAYFLNPLILLASDPVRNVRSTWLRIIGPHIKDSGRLAQCANIVAACKLMSMSELDKECNRYLSNIRFLPKSTLKRVDFLSIKDITGIIGQTTKFDEILSWNQQPLIKHFNLYMEEVLGSLWCLDNVPGSSLMVSSSATCAERKPFHSSERCSDLSIEYEMMLLEVRPNSSPTSISSLAPVITSDTSGLEFGPSYYGLASTSNALLSCRLGIPRGPSEGSETDPNHSDGVQGGSSVSELTASSYNSLELLHRPGIPRNYPKFICPSGAEASFQNPTETEAVTEANAKAKTEAEAGTELRAKTRAKTQSRTQTQTQNQTLDPSATAASVPAPQANKAPKKKHKSRTQKSKQEQKDSMVFDHKLHEATRNFFMVDITRAAADDLF
ncbi:phosphoprotein phosphatase 2A 65K regulatory chain-like protein [Cryptosporidium canis]|uniref:Phosphoprotein phosphatase 2A 65K regulatory chain-like protein n=1 Tax=Cryptosporidium canis TaxID=195482 RepID=A0A9D5HWC4_9CRYT|nr:phosphoprotein phosphatase 2A 65K regulatory chain-like protein [Cryptosporidium canis]